MLASSGLVGVVNGVALGVTLAVLLPSDLNISPVFSGPISSFQDFPIYFFVPIGTAVALAWVFRSRAKIVRWLVVPIGLAILVQSIVLSSTWIPRARTQFLEVNSAAATQLEKLQAVIPSKDEVVVSQGVLGRFANRARVFPFLDISNGGQVLPVYGRQVIFILTDQGVEFATAAGTKTAITYLKSIHAHEKTARDGVFAFSWNPPPGTRTMSFPATPAP